VAPESPSPKAHRSPLSPTVPDSWRVPLPPSKSKNARFPTEGRKAAACNSVNSTRRPASSKCTEAQHFSLLMANRRVQSPLSKRWNPSSPTEWQSATLQLSGGQSPKVHRGPAVLTVPDSERALAPLLKSKNAKFPTARRKGVTCYSAGGMRSPASPRYTEAQHFTMHFPAKESHFSL
jgi:hypothetical protein